MINLNKAGEALTGLSLTADLVLEVGDAKGINGCGDYMSDVIFWQVKGVCHA
jgi:hypothetical protein